MVCSSKMVHRHRTQLRGWTAVATVAAGNRVAQQTAECRDAVPHPGSRSPTTGALLTQQHAPLVRGRGRRPGPSHGSLRERRNQEFGGEIASCEAALSCFLHAGRERGCHIFSHPPLIVTSFFLLCLMQSRLLGICLQHPTGENVAVVGASAVG